MQYFFKLIKMLLDGIEHIAKRIRRAYYKGLFCQCGSGLKIGRGIILTGADKIKAGKNLKLKDQVIIRAIGGLTIGDNVTISSFSSVITTSLLVENGIITDHHIRKEIRIGSNVWLCAGTTVLGGVTIGDNVIVAAGAVVTSDLESGWIYAGIPAKKLKPLDPEGTAA